MQDERQQASPSVMAHRWINLYFLLYSVRRVSSKKEYCKSVGLCPQNFGAIEHDRQSVSMAVLCNTINKYGVRPDWLFLGEGDPF